MNKPLNPVIHVIGSFLQRITGRSTYNPHYPNLVIVTGDDAAGTGALHREQAAIATSWQRLKTEGDVKINILMAHPTWFKRVDGRLILVQAARAGKNGFPSEFAMLKPKRFRRPCEVDYLLGVPGLYLSASADGEGVPTEANMKMGEVEMDKELQVKLSEAAGIPTKHIRLVFRNDERQKDSPQEVRNKLETLRAGIRSGRAYFLQPNSRGNQTHSCVIRSEEDLLTAETVITAAFMIGNRRMLLADYIPSLNVKKEIVDSSKEAADSSGNFQDVLPSELKNSIRVLVTRDPAKSSFRISFACVFIYREHKIFKPLFFGDGIELTALDGTRLTTIDDFLSFTNLTMDEKAALKEKLASYSSQMASGVAAIGCKFDNLAVDFIISNLRDAAGMPEPYFLECSAHFAGERSFMRMTSPNTYRANHFEAAVYLAHMHRRNTATFLRPSSIHEPRNKEELNNPGAELEAIGSSVLRAFSFSDRKA
ncbi:MAG: hypothetical protein HY589_05340 [Candidatus Omnitrophica bacterium]|nr:hypothetical protein [Candidatus Omnitrophota bacterium]